MKRRLVVFVALFISQTVFASELIESADSVDDVNFKVVKILNKITEDSIIPMEKTRGFNYRYATRWYSPYKFEVYVGKFTKKAGDSIIRIESDRNGEAKVLRWVMEQEVFNAQATSPVGEIKPKSHALNQTINVFSPALSVLHSGYNSPFYQPSEMYLKSAMFLLIDLAIAGTVALYAQSTSKKRSVTSLEYGHHASKVNLAHGPLSGFLIGFLIIPRIYRSMEGYQEIATQNRFAELSYTFQF
jgi:hypothetical protein